MSEAARNSGLVFENVAIKVETGRTLKLAGVLRARAVLEEVPILSDPVASNAERRARAVRAFRAHGQGMRHEGVCEGDYVLVDPTSDLRSGILVLAEIGGQWVFRRVSHSADGNLVLVDPVAGALPIRSADQHYRVVGAFVGILRKRGFGSARANSLPAHLSVGRSGSAPEGTQAERSPAEKAIESKPVAKVTVLRSKLGMLELTCAATRNPRLQRALRNEANQVRRQLQDEAGFNKIV